MDVRSALVTNRHVAALAPQAIDALAFAFVAAGYDADHVFVRQGRRGKSLFLVVEGEVRVTRSANGRARDINRLGPGALFGLISLIDGEPASASCEASGPVQVASLTTNAFRLLHNAHATVAHAFQRALAAQLARDFRNVAARLRGAIE